MKAGDRVHIIGIGGIGTSAIAQWLQQRDVHVEGSDSAASVITAALQAAGIRVLTGEITTLDPLPQALIYSDAVPPTHPLRIFAKTHGIPTYSYAETLGQLTYSYQTIAIAGSHGKSTTTSLTGLLLTECGIDPTVVVGTRVPQWQTDRMLGNFRAGQSKIAVVEADEYRNHFLYLHPDVAVITSLDHDHLDAFPTLKEYIQAFEQFIARLHPGRPLIIHQDAYPLLRAHVKDHPLILYGMHAQTLPANLPARTRTVLIADLQPVDDRQQFSLLVDGQPWGNFSLRVPGVHMVTNTAAALAAALAIQPDQAVVRQAFKTVLSYFTGTWRRFEALGTINGAPAFSDYAHHPTELAALIDGAHQRYPQRRLFLIFQPHQRLRTAAMGAEFLNILRQHLRPIDYLIICEVYDVAGREDQATRVTTREWPMALPTKAQYVADLKDLPAVIKTEVTPSDCVIFTGAGSIDAAARAIVTPGATDAGSPSR